MKNKFLRHLLLMFVKFHKRHDLGIYILAKNYVILVTRVKLVAIWGIRGFYLSLPPCHGAKFF